MSEFFSGGRRTASPRPGPRLGDSISSLTADYREGRSTPADVVAQVHSRITERGDDGVWISVAELGDLLARAETLAAVEERDALPMYGIPFAVKDSIDIEDWQTTLACPGYARTAETTAPVVRRLLDAGAILVGKTNLDQFATGLNGTRTPYTIPRSVYGDDLISGGSSSGSALAVAWGEVPFAVATDTAGSGRVPPALNGVSGFKPSRGLISATGLVPACRSLDCVSLIAGTVADLAAVFDVAAAPDSHDPWSRERNRTTGSVESVRVGLPASTELDFFGDDAMAAAHAASRDRVRALFSDVVTPPLAPFLDAGELLYQGPWVAERWAEFGEFMERHPDAVLPVVDQIIRGGARFSAVDVFRAQYRLAELKAVVARLFTQMDVLILPTVGTTFTVAQVQASPITTNTTLGHYTHFGNLLDLCAAVVPAGTTSDSRPASTMVLGPALSDDIVLAVAARIGAPQPPVPAPRPQSQTLLGQQYAHQPLSPQEYA